MTDEEKLRKMFVEVHGELTGSCSLEITEEGDCHCIKDGQSCWHFSKTDILFDFVTKDFEHG